MRALDLSSGVVTWEGAVSVEQNDGWWQAWRVPYEEADLFPPLALNGMAAKSTGVRLTLTSNTKSVGIKMLEAEADYKLDMVCDGELIGTQVIKASQTEAAFANLPAGEKRVEVYLPQQTFKLAGLEIDDGASAAKFEDKRPRWITYGSSITNCMAAASPAQTWPALVARSKGWHLTCLGFGGNCHAEAMIARMMRDLPADFISLKLGINIYGGNSLGPRTFQAAGIGMVKIIRERHTDIPLVLGSPIFSPARETTPNAVGLTLVEMRKQLEEAVDILRGHGDAGLFYVDGLKILGEADAARLPDGVHPDAEGYRLMAKRFEAEVSGRIGL